jgi:hypothetical protein
MVMEEKYQKLHLEYTSSYLDTRIIIQMQKITKAKLQKTFAKKRYKALLQIDEP